MGKTSALTALRFVAELIFVLGLAGCDKKSGEAVVIEKEHIAAKEVQDTPSNETPSPSAAPEATPHYEERELKPGEITVGAYVMPAEDRGTGRDPRASSNEQWIVTVRVIRDGRQFNVQADQPRWEKLKEGDRVNVTYHVGKYTGTVWGSKIE
jgi:hypothetical protein